jgi:hypothetical protein
MSTIHQKRIFLARILYDNQAWELPDENIIAAYAAYHRAPSYEDKWIEYDRREYESSLSLDEQLGCDVVEKMSERDMLKAYAELESAEDQYQKLIISSRYRKESIKPEPLKHLVTPPDVQGALRDALYVCYFFFDCDGEVLYIGKTNNFFTRWSSHIKDKDIAEISRMEFHIFDSGPDVLFYEAQMILEHQPLWNKRDTVGHKSKLNIEPIRVVEMVIEPATA